MNPPIAVTARLRVRWIPSLESARVNLYLISSTPIPRRCETYLSMHPSIKANDIDDSAHIHIHIEQDPTVRSQAGTSHIVLPVRERTGDERTEELGGDLQVEGDTERHGDGRADVHGGVDGRADDGEVVRN